MSWLKDSLKGALGNFLYDVLKTWGLPILTGYLIAPGYALLAKLGAIHWNWRILAGLFLLAFIFNVIVAIKLGKGRQVVLSPERLHELQQRKQEALVSIDLDRADRNAETIGRRMTEIQEKVQADIPLVAMQDMRNPTIREHLAATGNGPKPVEPVEHNLIEQAFSIDQEMNWPEFRKIGIAVRDLNSSIAKHNELPDERSSHGLLREVEIVRKHIVIIERERLRRS